MGLQTSSDVWFGMAGPPTEMRSELSRVSASWSLLFLSRFQAAAWFSMDNVMINGHMGQFIM
jgi:hypothetical protein